MKQELELVGVGCFPYGKKLVLNIFGTHRAFQDQLLVCSKVPLHKIVRFVNINIIIKARGKKSLYEVFNFLHLWLSPFNLSWYVNCPFLNDSTMIKHFAWECHFQGFTMELQSTVASHEEAQGQQKFFPD